MDEIYREDTYVRVIGHLRALQGVRYVMAINIQPIEDCNEITYHILEVIHSHLLQNKVSSTVCKYIANNCKYTHNIGMP